MRGVILWALVACGGREPTTAETWRDALTASSWEEGRAKCLALPTELQAECVVQVMETHGHMDRAVCDALLPGVWHDECIFQFAERAAKAGKLGVAVEACDTTRFGRECSFHLVRDAAEKVWDLDLVDAAKTVQGWPEMQRAPDAHRLFWRVWFRKRLVEKDFLDPTDCPDEACRNGAREALYQSLTGLANAMGDDYCEKAPLDGWIGDRQLYEPSELTKQWVLEWTRNECMRRRPNVDKPGPP